MTSNHHAPYGPIKIAASISPIEAVRISTTTENEKLNTKKLRRKLTPENLAKIGFMQMCIRDRFRGNESFKIF